MQYGIYYAYWETEWGGNFVPYVEKCARLGFDVLEVACGAFDRENDAFFHELAAAARGNGMALTGGYGPRVEHDLATADNAQAEQTFRFYADMFRKMELAGIDRLGGALYSYWPAHGTPQTDKAADTARSVRRMQRLADLASDHGITLGMEALNRFEGAGRHRREQRSRCQERGQHPRRAGRIRQRHQCLRHPERQEAGCRQGSSRKD